MESCPKIKSAHEAMANMGFPQEIVKPVLRNLLQLYGENWSLIEDQGYSVLVDAIIESEERKEEEKGKKKLHARDPAMEDTPPAKRYKLRSETAESSSHSDRSLRKGKGKMIEDSDDSSDDDSETEQLADDVPMFEVPISTTPPGAENPGFLTNADATGGYCLKSHESHEGKQTDAENTSTTCQSAKGGSQSVHASGQKDDFPDFKEKNNGSDVWKLDLASSSKGEITVSITCHGSLEAMLPVSDMNTIMTRLEEKYAKIVPDEESFEAAAGLQSALVPCKGSDFQDVQPAPVPLKESETRVVQSALVPLKESDAKDEVLQSALVPLNEAELRGVLTESINKQHGFYISPNLILGTTVQFENLYRVSPQIPDFGRLYYYDLSRCKIDLAMCGSSGEKGIEGGNEDCKSVS